QFFVDEVGWNLEIHLQINSGFDIRNGFAGPQFLNRALQHLTVQVESNRLNMPMLLTAKQIAGAAQFQIEGGDTETCTQFGQLAIGWEAAGGDLGQGFIRRY